MARIYLVGVVDKWGNLDYILREEGERRPIVILSDIEMSELFSQWQTARSELAPVRRWAEIEASRLIEK